MAGAEYLVEESPALAFLQFELVSIRLFVDVFDIYYEMPAFTIFLLVFRQYLHVVEVPANLLALVINHLSPMVFNILRTVCFLMFLRRGILPPHLSQSLILLSDDSSLGPASTA